MTLEEKKQVNELYYDIKSCGYILYSSQYDNYVHRAKEIGCFDDRFLCVLLKQCSSLFQKRFFDKYVFDIIVEKFYAKGERYCKNSAYTSELYNKLIEYYGENWGKKIPTDKIVQYKNKHPHIHNGIVQKKNFYLILDWDWVLFYNGHIEINFPLEIKSEAKIVNYIYYYKDSTYEFKRIKNDVKKEFNDISISIINGKVMVDTYNLETALNIIKKKYIERKEEEATIKHEMEWKRRMEEKRKRRMEEKRKRLEYERHKKQAEQKRREESLGLIRNIYSLYNKGGGGWPEKYGNEYVSDHDRSGHWRICASGKKVWVRACKVKGHNRHY